MESSESLLPAEERLLDALRAGEHCTLIDPTSRPTAQEMKDWNDPSREIRAEFLRPFLLRFHPEVKPDAIVLHGALITGHLDLTGATIDPNVVLGFCKFDNVSFHRATFTGDALFDEAVFTGKAKFDHATFTGDVSFGETTFTRAALFNEATFTGNGWFAGATFTREALFGGAIFTGDTSFGGATFTRDAWFAEATFTGTALFSGATFTGDTWFSKATFTRDAWFDGAAFTGKAKFDSALALTWSLRAAQFSTPDPGPWIGSTVDLTDAVVQVHSRIAVTATTVNASRLQVREGGHLVIKSSALDLSDAQFLRRSILSGPNQETTIPLRPEPDADTRHGNVVQIRAARTSASGRRTRRTQIRREAAAAARRLADTLAPDQLMARCAVTSLARANIGELAISSIDLDDCAFLGAHGLDKLRISEDCTFRYTPRWSWRRPLSKPYTRRRVIAEETRWRRWPHGTSGASSAATVPAHGIAGIYRDLRKGLEDTKNEPGAGDFYYGEMEMRRLAGHDRKADDAFGESGGTSRAERALLYAYWAVSGYGLRASRAFVATAVLILAAALVFSTIGVAEPAGTTVKAESVDLTTGTINYPPQQPTIDGFGDALEMAGRNSIALLRNPGPVPELTAAGTIADVLLRLLVPALIGFGLLALRGRTKR